MRIAKVKERIVHKFLVLMSDKNINTGEKECFKVLPGFLLWVQRKVSSRRWRRKTTLLICLLNNMKKISQLRVSSKHTPFELNYISLTQSIIYVKFRFLMHNTYEFNDRKADILLILENIVDDIFPNDIQFLRWNRCYSV